MGDLRADIAATTDALKITVNKLVQRGENLDALNNRAEDLNSSSVHFSGAARRVRRQMWWQNCRLTFFISMFVLYQSIEWIDFLFSSCNHLYNYISHLSDSSSMEEIIWQKSESEVSIWFFKLFIVKNFQIYKCFSFFLWINFFLEKTLSIIKTFFLKTLRSVHSIHTLKYLHWYNVYKFKIIAEIVHMK